MNIAETMSRIAAELALFAGAGFLLFAINDVLVDLIYFTRRLWRGVTVYSRYPRVVALWITAERRQAIGQYGGGRNAFAFFAETGFYDRPMPWGFRLDGYAQGGVVGLSSRDLFADGGVTFSRPVYRQFSGGFGLWGGIQPGLYRVDAGPRLSMKVRRKLRVHFDYRLRLAGNAEPGSGPS
jgi:hypothetical protein